MWASEVVAPCMMLPSFWIVRTDTPTRAVTPSCATGLGLPFYDFPHERGEKRQRRGEPHRENSCSSFTFSEMSPKGFLLLSWMKSEINCKAGKQPRKSLMPLIIYVYQKQNNNLSSIIKSETKIFSALKLMIINVIQQNLCYTAKIICRR